MRSALKPESAVEDNRPEETGIRRPEARLLMGPPRPLSALQVPKIGQGTDYSDLPQYPRAGSELPPARKTDFLWRWGEKLAGHPIRGVGGWPLFLLVRVRVGG